MERSRGLVGIAGWAVFFCVAASPPLAAATTLYWTEQVPPFNSNIWEIRRKNPAGGPVEVVVANLGPMNTIWASLAIDSAAARLYWAGPGPAGARGVHRANLDGSEVETVVTLSGAEFPLDLALDPAGGKMYWTELAPGRVRRANLDGTGIEKVLQLPFPWGIAVDATSGKLYITNHDEVHRTDLDGSHDEFFEILADPLTGMGLREGDILCVGNGDRERLHMVDLETFQELGYTAAGHAFVDVAIHPEESYAYATDFYFFGIYFVPLSVNGGRSRGSRSMSPTTAATGRSIPTRSAMTGTRSRAMAASPIAPRRSQSLRRRAWPRWPSRWPCSPARRPGSFVAPERCALRAPNA